MKKKYSSFLFSVLLCLAIFLSQACSSGGGSKDDNEGGYYDTSSNRVPIATEQFWALREFINIKWK